MVRASIPPRRMSRAAEAVVAVIVAEIQERSNVRPSAGFDLVVAI
jgi:hypothetical protein